MNEKKRPTSVTVIAWIIIITGVVNLGILLILRVGRVYEVAGRSVDMCMYGLSTSYMGGLPSAYTIPLMIWTVVVAGISVVCGIALLKGLNWGRLLYLGFVPISSVICWILHQILFGFGFHFWAGIIPLIFNIVF